MNAESGITEANCAYLAALIDVRGCVYITREASGSSTYRRIVLEIHSLKPSVALWVASRFKGATIRSFGGTRTLRYVTKYAATICIHAFPYLQVRKEEARLVTRWATTLRGASAPSEDPEKIRLEVERDLDRLRKQREAIA